MTVRQNRLHAQSTIAEQYSQQLKEAIDANNLVDVATRAMILRSICNDILRTTNDKNPFLDAA